MKRLSFFCLCLFLPVIILAQTGIPVPAMSHCDQAVLNFLNTYDIPGATLALAKDGKLVYTRGFGHADLAGTEPVQPYHLFRIASVSKPITAIAIMKLVEDGQLSLSDKPFGPAGLLANHSYLSTVTYSDNRIDDITVQHLLEHSGGWNRDVDCVQEPATPYTWSIGHCDPIGFPLHVTHELGETNPVREEVLIRFLLEKGLDFTPGTQYHYSNIGYLVLGEIIAEVSGKSYEAYVKDEILTPLGCYDMHLGKNLLADKREREAEYEGNGYQSLSIYGSGNQVPWEYGGWNLEAMDAHGGWIASARDLMRLLVAVDGFATKPDILSSSSIQTMTTPSANASFYAKGWSVNANNHWWHNGALDGTASLFVRTSSGYTWALIVNKRIIDNRANQFWAAFDNLPWNCMLQTNSWPDHDLLEVPLQSSSNLTAAPLGGDGLSVSWTVGGGDRRVLVARAEAPVNHFPLDGTDYTAGPFSQGDDLGEGNFIVYEGAGSSVDLTGLNPDLTYHFQLFDYHQRATTGNHALYQLAEAPRAEGSPEGSTSLSDLAQLGISLYPNPTRDFLHLSWDQPGQVDRIELRNLQGQVLRTLEPAGLNLRMNVQDLPAQAYVLSCFRQGAYLGSARWLKE